MKPDHTSISRFDRQLTLGSVKSISRSTWTHPVGQQQARSSFSSGTWGSLLVIEVFSSPFRIMRFNSSITSLDVARSWKLNVRSLPSTRRVARAGLTCGNITSLLQQRSISYISVRYYECTRTRTYNCTRRRGGCSLLVLLWNGSQFRRCYRGVRYAAVTRHGAHNPFFGCQGWHLYLIEQFFVAVRFACISNIAVLLIGRSFHFHDLRLCRRITFASVHFCNCWDSKFLQFFHHV